MVASPRRAWRGVGVGKQGSRPESPASERSLTANLVDDLQQGRDVTRLR